MKSQLGTIGITMLACLIVSCSGKKADIIKEMEIINPENNPGN